jgi:hypothetical protein
MATTLSTLNSINEIAYLTGIFNWQMNNASYTNPNDSTVSFMVVDTQQVPIEQYVNGAVNAFNLFTGGSSVDPNTFLFNTSLYAQGVRESIRRKYVLNRVPLANYDVPVDLGVGSQNITFNVVFAGTMYQSAMRNFVQALFNNETGGLGTLTHPFYQKIMNVLPISFDVSYTFDSLNCMICEVTFLTSDITHLDPGSINTTTTSEISQYFIGTQNAVTSIGGTISATRAIGNNLVGGL